MYTKGMEKNTWENIGSVYTADGVKIVPGLKVWDYNYSNTMPESKKTEVVAPTGYRLRPDDVVWFDTANGGYFDGSRLSVRRPW